MADTWGPFYAAYIIVPIIYGAYSFSIWRRAKKAKDRLKELQAGSSRSFP
jgi:hypothetical protein